MCGRSENIKVGNNEVCIKTRTCYYSEDKIKFEDFGEDNLLIDENTYKNILVCEILYKVLIDPKPLCIRFEKQMDLLEFMMKIDFGPEKQDPIYNEIRYLIIQKSDVIYVIFHNYAGIKVDAFDYLPLEKTLTLHTVIIHIKSVLNKDQHHQYYNKFLEKCLYHRTKKNDKIFGTKKQIKIWHGNVGNMVV